MDRSCHYGFLLILVLAQACQRSPAASQGPGPGKFSIPVETTVAALERVEDRVGAVGSLEPDEIVQIKAEVEGRVTKVSFREGDPVKKGDVLFQLDDAKLRAAADAAEALATKAKNNRERSRQLREQNTISQQELDDIAAASKEANALLALARERLADATISSPLDGYISERLVSEGQYVDKDRTLVTVVDNDPMKLDFAVPERFLPQVQVGQKVEVRVAALPSKTFTGDVYFIDPQVAASTRTIKVKAKITNAAGELRAGMFANLDLVVGAREQAVVIPEQALVPQIDKMTVFVVENGVARRREVQIGARQPGKVEIVEGVKVGEQVITAGQQKLRDQMPVMPVGGGS